ncbi:MAG: EFR1 family ferrodoxin [Clostridiales bacterium]|nr:EFR1 family ferrodoxin [Clostridiales bacterium]
MKVVICYFSGTGNTAKIVEKYREQLTQHCDTVETYAMEKLLCDGIPEEFLNNLNDADLLGIGYPIHAFNAPSIVLKFVKSLPKATEKKRAFIFSASGEPLKLNNISSLKTCKLLKRRNYTVTNEYRYVMPYNIMFRHSDTMAFRMWDAAQKMIPLDVAEIVDGREKRLKRVFCGSFIAWAMRCEHWGGRLNGRMYKVDEKCAQCQKCVNVCPTKNVTLKDGKIKFGKNCLMCQRCIQLCPKDAIKMGLFNKWKVNGVYSFTEPTEAQEQKYNKMLTKSYKKYFEECNNRIEKDA